MLECTHPEFEANKLELRYMKYIIGHKCTNLIRQVHSLEKEPILAVSILRSRIPMFLDLNMENKLQRTKIWEL